MLKRGVVVAEERRSVEERRPSPLGQHWTLDLLGHGQGLCAHDQRTIVIAAEPCADRDHAKELGSQPILVREAPLEPQRPGLLLRAHREQAELVEGDHDANGVTPSFSLHEAVDGQPEVVELLGHHAGRH